MGRKHRPKVPKLFIPPREIDFVKAGIPSGHCLLCEEWIGVNGHEHHHHKPPSPQEMSKTKVFPKMAETPHIIVSPELGGGGKESPEFPSIDEDDQELNERGENVEQEEPTSKVENVEQEPQHEEVIKKTDDTRKPNGSPPPAYETETSPSQSPGKESPPAIQPQNESTVIEFPIKEVEEEGDLLSEDDPTSLRQRSSGNHPPVRRCPSNGQIPSAVTVPSSNDAYVIGHLVSAINQARGDPLRPSLYQSHSLSNSIAGSLGHSPRNSNSKGSTYSLGPSELLERKSRRHSMMDLVRRAESQASLVPGWSPPLHSQRSVSKASLVASATGRNEEWQREGNETMILCVSALYGKLLVVMGMAFPVADIISSSLPHIFYNTFYMYLYFGSILFLIYTYLFLLRTKSLPTALLTDKFRSVTRSISHTDVHWSQSIPMSENLRKLIPRKSKIHDEEKQSDKDEMSVSASIHKAPKYTLTESSNHGSMYLKMGAVLFGVGSMIYSGLEFGKYFELDRSKCDSNALMAITPVARMLFTFLQMYFIFLNSRVSISKHTIIARFGLMHMIGTNLCIWLNVLVQETEHEIAYLQNSTVFSGYSNMPHHGHHTNTDVYDHASNTTEDVGEISHLVNGHHIARRSIDVGSECRRSNLMGHVLNNASPFLFPCTIEYSLLCAGVLYVMWKNINVSKSEKNTNDADSDISNIAARKVRHHYSVDCARASRGLFIGIFVLVLTIISLIMFYVLISDGGEKYKEMAILEANIVEVSIYSLAFLSVAIGMKQMRELEFVPEGNIELDNILLLIAQTGVYIYTSFTIIGDYFSLEKSPFLSLLTAIITLVQTTLQTLFILDGSRRCCFTEDQYDRKPGREMVTFLLVCNLALWAISTFETSRADVHPTQLFFYGPWAWPIISHVSMPLAIFYRFHVTVCLGEIWKRAYKRKRDKYFIDF